MAVIMAIKTAVITSKTLWSKKSSYGHCHKTFFRPKLSLTAERGFLQSNFTFSAEAPFGCKGTFTAVSTVFRPKLSYGQKLRFWPQLSLPNLPYIGFGRKAKTPFWLLSITLLWNCNGCTKSSFRIVIILSPKCCNPLLKC